MVGAFIPQKLANTMKWGFVPLVELTGKYLPAHIGSRPQGRGWQPCLYIVSILQQKVIEHFFMQGFWAKSWGNTVEGINGFSGPRLFSWRRNNLEPPGKVRSHHSKLDSTSKLCAYNLPTYLKLSSYLPSLSGWFTECPTWGLRAGKDLLWHLAGIHPIAWLCLSCKMGYTGGLWGSSPGEKRLLINARSWTDVCSIRTLSVVDSEFSLIRRFWSYWEFYSSHSAFFGKGRWARINLC